MKLWLVCFVTLFVGAETAQWLGQLPWVSSVELSLPLTMAGGIGLAIASNYAILFGRSWPSFGSAATKPEPAPLPSPMPSARAAIATPVKSSKATPKGDTISFEIKKPRPKG